MKIPFKISTLGIAIALCSCGGSDPSFPASGTVRSSLSLMNGELLKDTAAENALKAVRARLSGGIGEPIRLAVYELKAPPKADIVARARAQRLIGPSGWKVSSHTPDFDRPKVE